MAQQLSTAPLGFYLKKLEINVISYQQLNQDPHIPNVPNSSPTDTAVLDRNTPTLPSRPRT